MPTDSRRINGPEESFDPSVLLVNKKTREVNIFFILQTTASSQATGFVSILCQQIYGNRMYTKHVACDDVESLYTGILQCKQKCKSAGYTYHEHCPRIFMLHIFL